MATCAGAFAFFSASRVGASVASLVISHRGTERPARADHVAFSRRRRSRKVWPSKASTSALTTPPMRVAMPPARTQSASSPRRIASSPAASSAACSAEPGCGASRMSVARGGSTVPRTRFLSSFCPDAPGARDHSGRARETSRSASKPLSSRCRRRSAGSDAISSRRVFSFMSCPVGKRGVPWRVRDGKLEARVRHGEAARGRRRVRVARVLRARVGLRDRIRSATCAGGRRQRAAPRRCRSRVRRSRRRSRRGSPDTGTGRECSTPGSPGPGRNAPPRSHWRAPRYSMRDGTYFYEPGGWTR